MTKRSEASILRLDHIPDTASELSVATQRLARLLRGQISMLLAAHGELGLVEWRICLCISQSENPSQKALVDFAGIEQAQVSRALMKLEQKGLIQSRQSDEDRRVRIFGLSDMGQAYFDRVQPVIAAYHQQMDAVLSEQEKAQFLDMVERVAKAAQLASNDEAQQAG
ncbi:MarR family winged helix-turn-helix transcriptional regulator [Maritalea mediterranea]|uniref:MarR family transcriptional regulator n=1 Tax=Maritalea mediterranea TaxID=2909667 RepID=A0ABS9EBL1_9HYPH|nr:MarR family transcriptional regulator [Maritalea mediterranea]MCF4099284.1 MarR family transcriptional regulator [Maritalea mediterranea]